MRVIGRSELIIQDPYSGSELTLYYKIPTTTQRIGFAGLITAETKMLDVYVAIGREVITGYAPGQFGIDNAEGVTVQVDSVRSSSFFDEFWLEKIFPSDGSANEDILAALGKWMMEGLNRITVGESKKKPAGKTKWEKLIEKTSLATQQQEIPSRKIRKKFKKQKRTGSVRQRKNPDVKQSTGNG